jgi:cell division ATPase FtsA
VIEPRYTELLNLVNEEICSYKNSFAARVKHHLAAGIVLTRRSAN